MVIQLKKRANPCKRRWKDPDDALRRAFDFHESESNWQYWLCMTWLSLNLIFSTWLDIKIHSFSFDHKRRRILMSSFPLIFCVYSSRIEAWSMIKERMVVSFWPREMAQHQPLQFAIAWESKLVCNHERRVQASQRLDLQSKVSHILGIGSSSNLLHYLRDSHARVNNSWTILIVVLFGLWTNLPKQFKWNSSHSSSNVRIISTSTKILVRDCQRSSSTPNQNAVY